METLGYKNVFIGTVEGEPEDTSCEAVIEKVKEAGIKKCAQILVGDFIDCDYEKSLLYDKSFTHEYRKGI